MSVWDLRRICRNATIWYDDQTREWWMDDRDPRVARERIQRHPAAINVTNAWEIWDARSLEKMAREAHWLENGPRGLAQSDDREAARPLAPPEIHDLHRMDDDGGPCHEADA